MGGRLRSDLEITVTDSMCCSGAQMIPIIVAAKWIIVADLCWINTENKIESVSVELSACRTDKP